MRHEQVAGPWVSNQGVARRHSHDAYRSVPVASRRLEFHLIEDQIDETIEDLVVRFAGRVWLVSKCGPSVERKTLATRSKSASSRSNSSSSVCQSLVAGSSTNV